MECKALLERLLFLRRHLTFEVGEEFLERNWRRFREERLDEEI